MSLLSLRVSRLDAAIRLVLLVAVLVFDGWALHTWSADWALLLFLHGFVTTAYLLFTALFRVDPIYILYDLSTVRGTAGERRAMLRARHRPQG